MEEFPDSWYPFFKSSELKAGRVKKIHAFHVDWVAFRGGPGNITVSQNICPHVGADLGEGSVHEGKLTCPLHHWKFDSSGQTPNASCRLKQRLTCQEYLGIVYVLWGNETLDFPSLPYDTVRSRICVYDFPAPYQMVGINAFDTEHLEPVHGRRLMADPKLEIISDLSLRMRYEAKVVGSSWRDRFLRTLGLKNVDIDIECLGGNFLIFTHHKVNTSTYFTLLPLSNNRSRLFIVSCRKKQSHFFASLLQKISLELQQIILINFIKDDFYALWNSRFKPEALQKCTDSSMRTWIEHYLELKKNPCSVMSFLFDTQMLDEQALRERAKPFLKKLDPWVWSEPSLKEIFDREGIDLATALAYEWALGHRASLTQKLEKISGLEGPKKILVFPTMYYKEHPELGGDAPVFFDVAKKLGIDIELIPTQSLGSVQTNAEFIVDFMKKESSKQVWVVSISKGSSDLKRAIQLCPEVMLPKIKGWISLVGMPGGTPLTEKGKGKPINHFLLKHWLRLRGGDPEITSEMGQQHAFSRSHLELPKSLLSISVVALPLRSHLRKPVLKPYIYLSQYGPNDGYVLFKDSILEKSLVWPIWGSDHYLRTPALSEFANWVLPYIKGVS